MAGNEGGEFLIKKFLAAGLFIAISASAKTRKLGIDDIISMAIQDSPDVRLVKQDYEIGKNEARTYLAQALPRLDFDYSFSKLDQLLTPTSGGGTISNSGGDSSQSQSSPPRLKLDNYGWTLSFSSPLYTFGRVGALYDMYSIQSDTVKLQQSYNTDIALLGVIRAYVDALSALKNKQVATKALESAKKTLSFTELEYRGGAMKEVDFVKSQARKEQAEAESILADVEASDKLTKLKIALGVPKNREIMLELESTDKGQYFQVPDYKKRTQSKQLRLTRKNAEFAEANKAYRSAAYYPSLGLFAQASGSVQKLNDPVSTEGSYKDSFDKDNRSTSYGVSLTWNFFAGGGDYANHRVAIAQSAQARIYLDRAIREDPILQEGAYANLKASRRFYKASLGSLRANRQAFASAESEFMGGAIPLYELIQNEEQLLEAEKQAIDALGALIMAIAQYRINNGWEIR